MLDNYCNNAIMKRHQEGENMKNLVAERKKWLKVKGLTIRKFADSMELDYNSVCRWFEGPRIPKQLYSERVIQHHPDFPVS